MIQQLQMFVINTNMTCRNKLLQLVMAFAMMKPTMFIVDMMEEIVAPLKTLLSKQNSALNVFAIANILNLLVIDTAMMQQTTQSATMMVETVVGLAYPVIFKAVPARPAFQISLFLLLYCISSFGGIVLIPVKFYFVKSPISINQFTS